MQMISRNVDKERWHEDSDVTAVVLNVHLLQAFPPARCARVRQPSEMAGVIPPGAPLRRDPASARSPQGGESLGGEPLGAVTGRPETEATPPAAAANPGRRPPRRVTGCRG